MTTTQKLIKNAMTGKGSFAEALGLDMNVLDNLDFLKACKDKLDKQELLQVAELAKLKIIFPRYSGKDLTERLIEAVQAVGLDEEKIKLDKETADMKKEIEKNVNNSEEAKRERMEVKLLEKAAATENQVEADKMREISKAYTDSYTLAPLIAMLDDEEFNNRRRKSLVRVSRLIDDFDFVLGKRYNANTGLRVLYDLMVKSATADNTHIRFTKDEALHFCHALAFYSRNITPSDEAGTWFMHSAVANVLHVIINKDIDNSFFKEKIEYLKKFFAAYEKHFPYKVVALEMGRTEI